MMALANGFCQLCRDTAIDLDALKAYYLPGDSVGRRDIRCPDHQDLAAEKPPLCRFAGQFSADCPLCQMIWNAVSHDSETPVKAIQLQAEQYEPHSIEQIVKGIALSPIRNVSFWFGRRRYYPCSLLNVVPWHCGQYGKFPEGYTRGTMGQLRLFTMSGRN